MEHDRNYKGVVFETYRKNVDAKFNTLHDELEDCYYQNWKAGKSKAFQGYDVQPTKEASKELFENLHGLIWHEHTLAMKAEHDKAAVKYPKFEARYITPTLDKDGNLKKSKVQVAQEQINASEKRIVI